MTTHKHWSEVAAGEAFAWIGMEPSNEAVQNLADAIRTALAGDFIVLRREDAQAALDYAGIYHDCVLYTGDGLHKKIDKCPCHFAKSLLAVEAALAPPARKGA